MIESITLVNARGFFTLCSMGTFTIHLKKIYYLRVEVFYDQAYELCCYVEIAVNHIPKNI